MWQCDKIFTCVIETKITKLVVVETKIKQAVKVRSVTADLPSEEAQLAPYFLIHFLVVTWHRIRTRLFWALYGIDLVVIWSDYCGQFAPNGC